MAFLAALQALERDIGSASPKGYDAEQRAEQTLLLHLNADQRRSWEEQGYFDVRRGGLLGTRTYRLGAKGIGLRIWTRLGPPRLDPICVLSTEHMPYMDEILAVKLLIEGDEKQFRRLAKLG